jgi:transcription elongation factor GreA
VLAHARPAKAPEIRFDR